MIRDGVCLSRQRGQQNTSLKYRPPFTPCNDRWLIIPTYHIFGSEELSVSASGIAQLVPKPYLFLNHVDAGRLGIAAGQQAMLTIEEQVFEVPVRVEPSLPTGVAAVPAGLPGMRGMVLPGWGTVSPVGQGGGEAQPAMSILLPIITP